MLRGLLNHYTSTVINDDRKNEYQDVDRNEEHVKNTARYKQMKPPEFMRKQVEYQRDNGEEDEKL